tara:strand:+ start:283 stop:972 length:690 start_codon:yes stop_codon:yes gene_type:complete
MDNLFNGCPLFNQPLNGWNVSGITKMKYMFTFASNFNQDISGWNVSNVTDMSFMFLSASSFNRDISGWDVGSETNTSGIFNYCPLHKNPPSWCRGYTTDTRKCQVTAPTPAPAPTPLPQKCGADYGTSVACCDQDNGSNYLDMKYQCPASSPTCMGYEFDDHLGHCVIPCEADYGRTTACCGQSSNSKQTSVALALQCPASLPTCVDYDWDQNMGYCTASTPAPASTNT